MTEKRRFPRAKEQIKVLLKIEEGDKQFEATVESVDISVTGIFLAAEFFLKIGTELDVEFAVPDDERPVRVAGVVTREVRLSDRPSSREISGFAIRFTEYHADAKTILAGAFLSAELDSFISDFLERRSRTPRTEHEQLRDVVVAWEVEKMEIRGGELDLLQASMRKDGLTSGGTGTKTGRGSPIRKKTK